MVLAMASRDREARPVAEGAWLPGRPCWRGLYEQARSRAEAAEARSEALKWAEVSARCEAGYWKWQFESSRRKRLAAVERTKDARRAAREALALRAEVARLGKLLADVGVASGRYSETWMRRANVGEGQLVAKRSRGTFKHCRLVLVSETSAAPPSGCPGAG